MQELEILKEVKKEFEPCIANLDYFEREGNGYYLEVLKKIKEFGLKQESFILDVGTGFGIMSIALSKMGFRAWALDNENCFRNEKIKDIFEKYKVKFNVVDVTVNKFPFPDNFFDLVVSLAVIDHLDKSPKNYLDEISRVLKKNGHFILVTPNWSSLENKIITVIKSTHPVSLISFYKSEDKFKGHIREYTVKEIETLLKWSNLKPIETYTINVADLNHYFSYKKIFKIIVRILAKILFFRKHNNERIISVSVK